MKALTIFLVFFIAVPLFFINKYLITSESTGWLSMLIVNGLFVLAAYIAIDCHRRSHRKAFWAALLFLAIGIGFLLLVYHTLSAGTFAPSTPIGRTAIVEEFNNYIYSYFGIYGIAILYSIESSPMFYLSYYAYTKWQT